MATLLELAIEACEDAGGGSVAIPSSIIGNDDPTAILLKSCARKVGRELVRQVRWEVLKKETSFSTVATVSAYSLPTDFQRFANLTFWNTSEGRVLIGPLGAIDWASLKRGITIFGIRYAFHVFGGFINITPTPTTVQTIGYDYYSKHFCTDTGGTPKENWTADSDLWRLDPDLATLGITYHFKAAKGLPYAKEEASYKAAIDALQFDDTPKPMIDVTGLPRGTGVPPINFTAPSGATLDSGSITWDAG